MGKFPEFNTDLKELKQSSLETIEKNKKQIEKLLKLKDKTYKNFVAPYYELGERLNFFIQPIFHLNGVKNSSKTQKTVKQILPALTAYSTEISQNKKLYEALKEIYEKEQATLSAEELNALKDEIDDFELEGVALEDDKKQRIKEINEALSELQNDFSQNVLDDTNAFEMILENEADVDGMPELEKESAKTTKDGKTVYKFTLQQPSYLAYLTYGPNRAKREELYKAYSTRGTKNGELITKILALRDEKAKILGFDSFASYSLATKMASSHSEVLEFLRSLAAKSKVGGQKDFEELKGFAAKDGNTDLQSYDTAFYSERLRREAFDIDEEYFKQYFELNSVLDGMFEFLKNMFGIEFKEVSAKLWDKGAKAFDMYENGVVSGRLYMDLCARRDKKGGAWMDNWLNAHIDVKDKEVLPVAFIVCNFPKQTKKTPSLLRHYDIETLFHEMGHALHHLLSKNKVPTVSGVNGVMWDVVEFPSQFLENFAYKKEVLKMFSYHYKTKEPLSDEDIARLQRARNFQSAMGMLRQLEFGIFDMRIHSTQTDEAGAEKILGEVRDEVAVIRPPEYNKFKNSFSHIFSGRYAAGYYSYKWAEVLSADAFFMFEGKDGELDYTLGSKIRETVFAKGGAFNMREIYREFAGRDANVESLLKLYGIA